ncbi:PD-(D/E)XK nuclease family protein [Dickeya zeae]|uniref:PD-(D/E)XK nuclease family protein n=1 Tax=Dickeya zeae TaxID=204042 RepID=UPI0003A1E865|nr:PD-(D/E)XK nuclease family protein [Dickeya zeae]
MYETILSDSFLSKVEELDIKDIPEPNFYDIGGSGYLENPTSDLMSVFMGLDPNIKPWLLKSLLQLLGQDVDNMDFSSLTVQREVVCKNGERLDIVIIHDDFIIGIENKVYSSVNNPFKAYDECLESLKNNSQEIFKCILKPEINRFPVFSDWTVINYSKLVEAALSRVGKDITVESVDKWFFFYKEFLSHLLTLNDNNVSNVMNKDQSDFIINNFDRLLKAKELLSFFEEAVYQEGKDIVAKILPDSTIVKSANNWEGDYKALNFKPSEWGNGSSYLRLVYRPSKEDTGVQFYVDAEINENEYPELSSLKNEVETQIRNNAFLKTASDDEYGIDFSKSGRHLTLSFWGSAKDKAAAMALLEDMTTWMKEKISLASKMRNI